MDGFAAQSSNGVVVDFVVSDSQSTDNISSGLAATGMGTTVAISGSTFSRNGTLGVNQDFSSTVSTHLNNAISENGISPVAGTLSPIPLQ